MQGTSCIAENLDLLEGKEDGQMARKATYIYPVPLVPAWLSHDQSGWELRRLC